LIFAIITIPHGKAYRTKKYSLLGHRRETNKEVQKVERISDLESKKVSERQEASKFGAAPSGEVKSEMSNPI